jgi:hypothetical protein
MTFGVWNVGGRHMTFGVWNVGGLCGTDELNTLTRVCYGDRVC